MQSIYLDHAAATPLDPTVQLAMQPYLSDIFYNPSALYQAARDTRSALEAARARVAGVIGARPTEVIFTAGGTESDNLAIHGLMRRYPQARVVVSAIEHDAVLLPAQSYDVRIAPVDTNGILRLDALAGSIDDQTVLVSVMYANNEIGTVQPIARVGQLIKQIRDQRRQTGNQLPIYLHTDACQAANYLDLQAARLGVDMMTLNGGKMYGPKQSGILFVKGGLTLQPLLQGGGQERGMRSGTENVAACVGFAEALHVAQTSRHAEVKRLSLLQTEAIKQLQKALPQAVIRGSQKQRLPNNIHFSVPGIDNERLLIQLDAAGIQAAAGSACSASSDTPSHVLRAIGLTDDEARASLRLTMGRTTTSEQMRTVIDTLQRLVA